MEHLSDAELATEWASTLLAELPAEQAQAVRERVVRKRVSRGLAAIRAAIEEVSRASSCPSWSGC